MKSYFRILYLYIISAITLVMIVGGVIATLSSVAEYKYPQKDNYSSYYDDDEDYAEQIYNEEVKNVKMIFTDMAVVLVAIPLYVYHWRRIEKERMEMEV